VIAAAGLATIAGNERVDRVHRREIPSGRIASACPPISGDW
jgi:hypothetical protein